MKRLQPWEYCQAADKFLPWIAVAFSLAMLCCATGTIGWHYGWRYALPFDIAGCAFLIVMGALSYLHDLLLRWADEAQEIDSRAYSLWRAVADSGASDGNAHRAEN